jgi:hypothetical protein
MHGENRIKNIYSLRDSPPLPVKNSGCAPLRIDKYLKYQDLRQVKNLIRAFSYIITREACSNSTAGIWLKSVLSVYALHQIECFVWCWDDHTLLLSEGLYVTSREFN